MQSEKNRKNAVKIKLLIIIKLEKMSVLVGKKAPQFNAKAVVNGGEIVDGFSLDQFIGKKYVVLFFYPKDYQFHLEESRGYYFG